MAQPIQQIMMVDDDPDVLYLYGKFFELGGFGVLKARDGFMALDLLDEAIPDIFILDVMTPEMTGIEFCQRIRARPETADTPVVMLSAWGDGQTIKQAYDAGADDYLVKPIDPLELEAKVQSMLARIETA